jgi:hypothetical protein
MARDPGGATTRKAFLPALCAGGFLVVGLLRCWQVHLDDPPAVAGNATALYVTLTVFDIIAFTRVGVPLQGLGFGISIHSLRAIGRGH